MCLYTRGSELRKRWVRRYYVYNIPIRLILDSCLGLCMSLDGRNCLEWHQLVSCIYCGGRLNPFWMMFHHPVLQSQDRALFCSLNPSPISFTRQRDQVFLPVWKIVAIITTFIVHRTWPIVKWTISATLSLSYLLWCWFCVCQRCTDLSFFCSLTRILFSRNHRAPLILPP